MYQRAKTRLSGGMFFVRLYSRLSSKTKGPGEKGAPRNHPEISSRKLADFELQISI